MLTKKDLEIINNALAYYQTEMDHQEKGDLMWDNHAKEFGHPLKTIEATRIRVFNFIKKRGA